jgi:nucleoid-associated protein YgaU
VFLRVPRGKIPARHGVALNRFWFRAKPGGKIEELRMQKDFKIGLGVGLLFVVAVAVWLSTRPNLSTEARALQKAPNTPPIARQSEDELRAPHIEPRTTNNEPRTIIAEKTLRTHVVEKGETLSGIAAKYYGSPRQWPKIVAANKSTLPDPNRLLPGTRLLIPE